MRRLTNPVDNDVSQYPVMVITPDYDIRFANSMLTANSVYFVDLKWGVAVGEAVVETVGTSWYVSNSEEPDSVKYDFDYKITFMPNDPQLN